MLPQQYCLRWKYHHSNLQTMFSHLLDRGCFCDVTLACEGQLIRAHRVVLCACSTFFDQVLTNYASERDPIIIIKDVTFSDVKCLIEFMYKGEINVEHASLASLLKTADDLKIKGLAEVSWRDEETDPVMMDHHLRIQENIPHNDQRSSPRNYHDGRPPSSPLPPSSSGNSNSRSTPRMPMLTPMPSSSGDYVGPKRKRGRPPLDDSYDVFSAPKIPNCAPPCEMMYPEVRTRLDSSPPPSEAEQQQQQQHQHHNTPRDSEETIQVSPEPPREWSHQNVEEDNTAEAHHNNSTEQSASQETNPGSSSDFYPNPESHDQENDTGEEIMVEEERKYSIDQDLNEIGGDDQDEQGNSKLDESETNLTKEELAQWDDVVKMDAYLATGRRPQFWEEPFTKRVLDAIKNKKLEMKKAAKLLGVSYGTLYGRYREVYGCLKHPYRPSTTMMNRFKNA
ncbi:protein bric-a-brac 1 isoform X2 [Eupeodes corollae]|uniref:protein bric-a-brac 1 isoform X2 n=1 Tax=Eupeodes corollae TaxID=290404 RepID=UPI0024908004|nr:protein bric-a-brac 1 isoform X2 [Eupeodes corollae]